MPDSRSADDTRDIAIKAMADIKNLMVSADRRYVEQQQQQQETMRILNDISEKVSNLNEDFAEARGAAKMAKYVAAVIGVSGGFIGGLAHHIIFK